MSPAMWDVFRSEADLTPYAAKPARVRLDEVNPPRKALQGKALHWARKSMEQTLERVDEAEEDAMNRILWHAMKGVDAAGCPVELSQRGAKKAVIGTPE